MNAEHTCGCIAERDKAECVDVARQAECRSTYLPRVDIVDSDKETRLVMDMPGVSSENIDITVEKNVLTISGKQDPEEYPGRSLAHFEYGVGNYRRSFTLSEDTDKDGISAAMKDGVLTVNVPKTARESRKITIAVN